MKDGGEGEAGLAGVSAFAGSCCVNVSMLLISLGWAFAALKQRYSHFAGFMLTRQVTGAKITRGSRAQRQGSSMPATSGSHLGWHLLVLREKD